jgi:hypothetical protein
LAPVQLDFMEDYWNKLAREDEIEVQQRIEGAKAIIPVVGDDKFIGYASAQTILEERKIKRHLWMKRFLPKAGLVALLALTNINATRTLGIESVPSWAIWEKCSIPLESTHCRATGIKVGKNFYGVFYRVGEFELKSVPSGYVR